MPKADKTPADDTTTTDKSPEGEAAEVAEVEGRSTIDVEWGGRSWTVAASYAATPAVAFRGMAQLGAVELSAMTPVQMAGYIDVLEALLGPAQFRSWAAGDRNTTGDAFELVRSIVAAWGTTPGE